MSQANTSAAIVSAISAEVRADVQDFADAYVGADIAQAADDRAFAAILKGQSYAARQETRRVFVEQATFKSYAAPEKLWERTFKRINEFFDVGVPKAETKKAVETANKRNAAKAAAEVIAKAKLGKPIEQATPAELKQLATDKNLITANKEALVNAALQKEKAEKKEAEKAANVADKALRDEARELLNKLHGKSLEKALAALRKIK